MEEILQEFNNLVDEMAEAVASARNPQQAARIQEDFDERISKAEIESEQKLEEFFKKEQEQLEKEQKESEIPEEQGEGEEVQTEEQTEEDIKEEEQDKTIKDNSRPFLDEFKKYVKKGKDAGYITKKFKEVEIIEIGKAFNFKWTTEGLKIEKVRTLMELIG